MSAVNKCAISIQDSHIVFCYIMEKNPKKQGKNKKGENSNTFAFYFPQTIFH
jgi:hypothetical protein